jgi:hypothetical protein
MTTPSTGTLTFIGASGLTYQKAFYWADATGTMARIDSGLGTPGATGGQDFCIFNEPVTLVDISVVTGPTVALTGRFMANYEYIPIGFSWTNHLNTLPQRPQIRIPFKAGTRISILPQA